MTCDDCIHSPVCYKIESVSTSYADKCGDFKHDKKPENIQELKEYAEWLPQYEGKWVAESEGK